MPKAPKKFIYLLRLSLAIVAIDGSATAAEKTVTFSSWSPIVETTNKMIAAFHEKNPDMKIDPKIFNYPDYLVELQTWAAGNSLPDIIGLEPGTITQQYKNFLLPLQDLAVKVWGKDWKEKFYPIAIEQARLGNPKGDENFYGLPVLTQTINLWYTVPIFQEIGAQPPRLTMRC
jgi:raffinose/stachyose/melibiose transport system substrate-binding protein